ncbi:MAG: hypothetical protein ACRDRR_12460 [Pseudonocardiaceae bacterium]
MGPPSALVAEPGFAATSHGYLGTSDGWTDLAADGTLNWRYPHAGPSNVVQTGQLKIDGLALHRATLALGFGAHRPRDLYQVASAMLAAGDRAGADRAVDCMLRVQQRPDGHLPQNTRVDGTLFWTGVQLDETAAPILLAGLLAGLLGRTDKSTLDALRRAAEFLVYYRKGRQHRAVERTGTLGEPQRLLPATVASAVAGLVCLADLLKRAGDTAVAERYLTIADRWQSAVGKWTATSTGPLSPRRTVLAPVHQRRLRRTRRRRAVEQPTPHRTYGRLWPILAGERGEYDLLAGDRPPGR